MQFEKAAFAQLREWHEEGPCGHVHPSIQACFLFSRHHLQDRLPTQIDLMDTIAHQVTKDVHHNCKSIHHQV